MHRKIQLEKLSKRKEKKIRSKPRSASAKDLDLIIAMLRNQKKLKPSPAVDSEIKRLEIISKEKRKKNKRSFTKK